ncbi:ABC transporter related protein [[Clostridium] saccharolyticum WM1]|uniref:ABC transporter related protein n=2 Tax=Lacrimispora TaxID=2719231 RepID=D9R7F0_LACSW|nr:ABC transporter ATP-binding protein [Lacrimispora saccharolytica]ADL03679.1 ABC transporter related protein [[Clostridium] saccharolyticum WM1]QRV22111.1 ABC transporter ATP-binding protein [Lacrimispora saccharolytica]
MNRMIEVANLRKSYGNLTAVKDLSFYVEQGKLFSFLGPNGAGKSTTIDILCTLLDFDSGEVIINGLDLRRNSQAIRQMLGVVFQEGVLDDLLTVRENLNIRAGLYTSDKARIKNAVYAAAAATELNEILDRPYEKLSGGQRRRADIARAILPMPRILFLDEPTTGLDPQTRKSIWNTIRELQGKTGMTVFLTTHYMEEAAQSDYVVVIDHGVIAAKGTPTQLKTRYASDTLRLSVSDEAALRKIMEELKLEFTVLAGEYIVKLPNTMAALPIMEKCQGFIRSFQVLQGTMDDAFIGITGKELRQ